MRREPRGTRGTRVDLASGDAFGKGDKGDPGPSDAYTVGGFGSSVALPETTAPAVVGTLNVPAGSYVFIASARLRTPATSAAASNADCFIKQAGVVANSNFSNVNLGAGGDRKIVSLNWARTVGEPATVQMQCEITGGGPVTADEVFFSAIKVGAITSQ